MKRKHIKLTKKLLSVVLVCMMLIAAFPISAFAAVQKAELWVGASRIDVSEEGYWLNDGKGGITATGASESNYNVKLTPEVPGTRETAYVPATLTLKDASLSKCYATGSGSNTTIACIYFLPYGGSRAQIVLEGENSIDVAFNGTYTEVAGIKGVSSISGDGSLNITATVNPSYAARAVSGDISITDNAKVTVFASGTGFYGNLTVKDNAAVAVSTVGIAVSSGLSMYGDADFTANAGVNGSLLIAGGSVEICAQSGRAVSVSRINFETNEMYGGDPIYKYAVVKVNKKAKAFGALRWNDKNPLSDYSYVKITAPSHFEYFIKKTNADALDFFGTKILGPIIVWIIQQFI